MLKETTLKTVQIVDTRNSTVEVLTNQEKKLVKIKGQLTSNLRSRKSSNTPAMAFFWLEDCIDCHNTKQLCQTLTPKHKNCQECAQQKCKECEIPVVFRIANSDHDNHLAGNFTCVFKCREFGDSHWTKPQLKKGDRVILEGIFANSDQSNRPSFTVYSYQKIND